MMFRLAYFAITLATPLVAHAEAPFAIRIVDEAANRGVPLVELKTTTDQTYLTDSNGYVAIDDPALMDREAFFHVASHGYEFPKDLFGYRGKRLQVKPGGEATIPVKRINVAQRLYRITGAGIYRDSVKLGKDVPIEHPLLNAEVCGQDTVQAVVKGDRIYWFWGDTERLSYPMGQFNTSGAVSKLPSAGGLDPTLGVDLEYFVGDDGFSRPMFQRENGVLIWVHGAFTALDPQGELRVLTHYSRRKSLADQLSHGLAVLNEDTNLFETIHEYPKDEKVYPRGQSFTVRDGDTDYIYFAEPYALVRVPATWNAVTDPAQWEAFSPLKPGTTLEPDEPPQLDRASDGTLNYAWKKNAPPVNVQALQRFVKEGHIKAEENHLRTVDAADGAPVLLHAGSIKWNEFRQRWILIAHQGFGKPSFLGEVWYAEARKPEGPFEKAVRIVTHQDYSFYNVTQHDFFDQDGGRTVLFEGTYTNLFTDAPPTPWYDYNQIMYGLDLTDARLEPAFVE